MKIRVTEDDIFKAVEARKKITLDERPMFEKGLISEICPIALACQRQLFEWAENIRVGDTTISCRIGGGLEYVRLPNEAQWFVTRFDNNEPVGAFDFDIESKRIEKPVKITLDEPTEPLECELVKV